MTPLVLTRKVRPRAGRTEDIWNERMAEAKVGSQAVAFLTKGTKETVSLDGRRKSEISRRVRVSVWVCHRYRGRERKV